MGHAAEYGDDDFEYDDTTSNEFDTFCKDSMCCKLHTAEVPGDAGCVATWLGFANGATLLFIFGWGHCDLVFAHLHDVLTLSF
jgi:hypothetical protein